MNQDHLGHQGHLDMMVQQAIMAHLALKENKVNKDFLAKKVTMDHLVQKDILVHQGHLVMSQDHLDQLAHHQ